MVLHSMMETLLVYFCIFSFQHVFDFGAKLFCLVIVKNEINVLLEVGFKYICEKDELYYIRKRK